MFENELAQWIVVALIGVITYFLKQLHTDIRKHSERVFALEKSYIELSQKYMTVEQRQVADMMNITKIFELKLEGVTKQLEHMNNNLKSHNNTATMQKMLEIIESDIMQHKNEKSH
jgi:hypothetical protein